MPSWSLACGAVAAALLLIASAPASGQEGTQTLLQRSGPGTTWTAATVTTGGAVVTSRIRVEDVALPLHLGARLYDEQRRLVSTSNLTLRSPEEGVLVQSEPTGDLGLTVDELDEKGSGRLRDVEGTFTLNPSSAVLVGTYSVVLWVATQDSRSWSWQVEGGDGTAVLGATTGPRVFLGTSRDFATGIVNVAAGTYAAGSSAQVRGQAMSTLRRQQRSNFVGSYYPVLSSADTLSVQTPSGVRQCLPDCQFDGIGGVVVPGEYVFRLSGVGAGGAAGQNAGDVVVAGAEVVLPASS